MVVFYAVATDSGGLLTVPLWIFCGWEKFTLRFKEKSKDDARVGDDGVHPKPPFAIKARNAKTTAFSSSSSSVSSSSSGLKMKYNNKRRKRRGDLKTNAINLRYSIESSLNTLANLFPLWIVLGALVGLFNPTVVAPLSKSEIVTRRWESPCSAWA